MLAQRLLWIVASITGESQSNSNPEVNILIGWMLANTGDATLELNLSQLQCYPDARDATLVPASCCEPALCACPK